VGIFLAQGRDQRPPKHEEVADVLDLREGGLQALADYVLAESLQAAGPASIHLRHTHSLALQSPDYLQLNFSYIVEVLLGLCWIQSSEATEFT
jgi:hypothetical protein